MQPLGQELVRAEVCVELLRDAGMRLAECLLLDNDPTGKSSVSDPNPGKGSIGAVSHQAL